MGDQYGRGDTGCLQKLFRCLLVQEIERKGPHRHADQEGQELACTQHIFVFVRDDVDSGYSRQYGDGDDSDPVEQPDARSGQDAYLEQRGKRNRERREVAEPDTPTQQEPVDGTYTCLLYTSPSPRDCS